MKERRNTFLDLIVSTVLLLSFLLNFTSQAVCAQKHSSQDNGPKNTQRKFVFSDKTSLGKIYTYSAPPDDRAKIKCYRILDLFSRPVGIAKGTWSYSLGPNLGLCFEPSYAFLENPEGLKSVDSNAFECVTFPLTASLAQVSNTIPFLAHLSGLCRIEVEGGEVTDDQLLPLKTLVNIECAILRGNALTGSCFKTLSTWTKLKHVDLSYNPLTHDACRNLAQFRMLEIVRMDKCKITDSDLKELSKLPNLKVLSIAAALITPSGLESILNMKRLTQLDLSGTKLLAIELAKLSSSSIVVLKLSPNSYMSSELIRLRRALPGKTVSIPDYSDRLQVEDQSLFAPLH